MSGGGKKSLITRSSLLLLIIIISVSAFLEFPGFRVSLCISDLSPVHVLVQKDNRDLLYIYSTYFSTAGEGRICLYTETESSPGPETRKAAI
jgi:hypothetical protein